MLFSRCLYKPLLAVLIASSLVGCPEPESVVRYTITVENQSNQPMGPIVAATHPMDVVVWAEGQLASGGMALLSETGVTGPLVDELDAQSLFTNVLTTTLPMPSQGRTVPRYDPMFRPGPDLSDSQTIVIDAFQDELLSLAGGLLGTNDGFWGLDRVPLPAPGAQFNYDARGYDAGVEENNELDDFVNDDASILGPTAIPGDEPELEMEADNRMSATSPPVGIREHGGITGEGDIPADFDFSGVVARVSILAASAS